MPPPDRKPAHGRPLRATSGWASTLSSTRCACGSWLGPGGRWYDKLVGDEGSDYHQQVIPPAAFPASNKHPTRRARAGPAPASVLMRQLLDLRVGESGVDASPSSSSA